ncbi:MAG TPA: hypothetical protein VFN28_02920 [Amaricoccus sp.]|nr:hypothetical protein [Amaricoccus sp.]
MRIAFVVAILGLGACTTVQQPADPVVVTPSRPATTVVVPAKPVAVVPADSVLVPAQ